MRRAVLMIAVCLLAACMAAKPKTTMSMKDQMKQVVEPASNTLFAIQGEVDPANGPTQSPADDARWRAADTAAHTLKEVALTLVEPERAKDQADWKMYATDMGKFAEEASAGAKKKDGAALSNAVNALSDNCAACHKVYKLQTAA